MAVTWSSADQNHQLKPSPNVPMLMFCKLTIWPTDYQPTYYKIRIDNITQIDIPVIEQWKSVEGIKLLTDFLPTNNVLRRICEPADDQVVPKVDEISIDLPNKMLILKSLTTMIQIHLFHIFNQFQKQCFQYLFRSFWNIEHTSPE